MISVGSRDGRKGLSLRYGVEGGDMDLETELEEGEACFQNNNDDDDDSKIDPDVALSYLDEKLQDVLGHFQKDFEGVVLAENLGAKFGIYGSFLPTYQRSPAGPHSKTPPKVHVNNASPNDLHLEGGRQNSVSIPNVSQITRHGAASTSGAPPAPLPRGLPMNGKVKHEVHVPSARAADKFTSNNQQSINDNSGNSCDQKSLKVRIKVGSDNLSTRKNAEIYSGLGLDVSPSSSVEATPANSDDLCHVPNDVPCEESPTSILEMMTSFPILGGLLLSPLPYDLLYFTEKEKREDSSCGSVHKRSQENTFTVNKSDSKTDWNEKKPKTEDNFASGEPINGIGNVKKEESLDFRKGDGFKGEPSVMPKEESLDPIFVHGDVRVEKPIKKDKLVGDASSDEKFVTAKSDSDVSKSGKILDTGLVKPPKQMLAHKATSHEKDGMKLPTSSSGSKKKSKGSQTLENGLKNDNFSSKNKNNSYGSKSEEPKTSTGKVRETYKDFFGELDPELDFDELALADKPVGDKPKDYRDTEKGTLESDIFPKERLNGKNDLKPSSLVYPAVGPMGLGPPTMGNGGPLSDTAAATVPAVVNEDWVCCDKCEKWRLLPLGVNPGSLPEKWLCSMLYWLPGMNKCSISQEETTKAMTTHFPSPAPMANGLQPVQPSGPQPGPMSVEPVHTDQRHQPLGPQSGVKKKHGIKDLSNEPKQERPSMSSNSTKRNLQTSNKTRSLNGANQSPVVNEIEFQDSGHSSSLIAEKHRLEQKEKKKTRDNFADEGNNTLQVKIRNKRETSEDYSRDSKKVKTDDNHRTHKDRASDYDAAVFKTINNTSINDLPSRKDHQKYYDHSKDSKSTSKVLGVNPKHPNGTLLDRDLVKKRKSHEFDDDTQVEETSENGQRKGKKVKGPETQEEEKGRLLAATSSSSKVSSSHKTKTNNHETKGSPVESVSSSPLRILNPDKLTSSRRNIGSVDNSQDPKKDWEDDRGNYRSNIFKKELDVAESLDKVAPSLEFEAVGVKPSIQGERRNDDQSHSNGSRSRKNGKGSSSRSKEKNRSSKSDVEKVNLKTSEHVTENSDVEKSKGGQNRSVDKIDNKPSVNPSKFEKGSASKKESSGKPVSIHDLKQNNMPIERESEKSKRDVSAKGKLHSLPPSGKSQSESTRPQPIVGSQKENVGNRLLNDGVEGSDVLKSIKQKKKDENQNGTQSVSIRHPTPSPLRRESSSQAASAIKEAKALKHMADRLKNSGENHESNSLYFQAVLKFLYGSSLLESSYTESGKHGDMLQSMSMYSSTAKLCEYVAHEYEKVKEMAAAALAYKLAEVAYLKVVYSSHTSASKDRQELQTSLQIGHTGESPSSSASDIDNLNNPAAVDKNTLAKGVNDPQIGGNHVIAARIKPNFLRILNFAQDVNFAMEASRRSQVAFAACGSQPEHSHHKEVIKPALDFHFQDVEGLLQLVRVAMEVIST